MFEKIKDISKILIIPTSLLYFFGFLSITSYYARFGISSFDILNSRFIIAGFFSLISLIVVFYISWSFYSFFDTKYFLKFNSWKNLTKRPIAYLLLIAYTFIASTILQIIFSLGYSTETLKEENLLYKLDFGKYDFLPIILNKLDLGTPSIDFIIKTSTHIFFYFVIATLLFKLIIILVRYFKSVVPLFYKKTIKHKKTEDNLIIEEVKQEKKGICNLCLELLAILVEALPSVILMSIFFYSITKLYVNVVNVNSINNFHIVNFGLIFSWLFILEACISFFLILKKFPKEKEGLKEFFTKLNNPYHIQHVLQILIIPIFIALFLFGITIFPRIPYAIGGGQPREVSIVFKQSEHEELNTKKIYQIGENSNFIFIVTYKKNEPSQAMQINKNIINIIKTTTTTRDE